MSENEQQKKKVKKIDKSRLAIKIVAAVLALAFIVPTVVSAIIYLVR